MFKISWNDFSDQFRGTVFIVLGTILLLHTLHILENWLNLILILVSCGLIAYGFIQAGLWPKIVRTFKKNNKA